MPKRAYEPMFDMEIGTFSRSARFAQTVTLTVPEAEVRADVEWMICNDNTCMPPEDTELTVVLKAATPSQPSEGGSLWAFIIEAILWGFAAMLTPCVFPMIPMTVSYFLKGEGGAARGRMRAALYGLFIVALYTVPIAVIILATRLLGGDAVTADIFNWLATHWLPNILFSSSS